MRKCQKRPITRQKETYSSGKRGLLALAYGKRDLFIRQKRPIHMAKKTYSYGKRDLFIWQKRPTHMSKETYSYVKSDLIIWQKRPHHMAKEAYLQVSKEAISYVKRDLIPPRTSGSQALPGAKRFSKSVPRLLVIWQKRPNTPR